MFNFQRNILGGGGRYLLLLFAFGTLWACCEDEPVDTGRDLTGIPFDPQPYFFNTPPGYPTMEIPADNPITYAGVQLGRHLFYDPILSGDSTMSCGSCHKPEASFTDGLATSPGIDGISGRRGSMSLLDIGYAYKGLFWDGRASTLEEQALLPVEDPIELHHNWPQLEVKLRNHGTYPTMFRQAFGISNTQDITKALAAKAIAQFERILVSSGQSRFDQIRRGEDTFTEEEDNGHTMFFDLGGGPPDAECAHCHNAPLMTVNEYFNNGIQEAAELDLFKDAGRGEVTRSAPDNGKFKAPTLRNIALTAPYMHNGSLKTLEEVVRHYSDGGHYSPNKDALVHNLKLSEKQQKAIVAFLHTLTDTVALKNPMWYSPF